VDEEEEWRRIGPVVWELAERSVRVSVDTTRGEVARRAVEAGAVVINDVSGLRNDAAIAELAAGSGAGLIIMHMRGDPRTMQDDVAYDDLIGEVKSFLARQAELAVGRGCRPEQIVVDPGIGFGKSAEGSLELIARLAELVSLGRPVLVGPSRKSFIGAVLDLPPHERLEGTLAASLLALDRGARLFRVHDVAPARRALEMAYAIMKMSIH
jgi:dihydropteroate synthase